MCAQSFQPTLPARGATLEGNARRRAGQFQPTLPAISTHAPRTGSDGIAKAMAEQWVDFNPRSPHGERRNCDGFRPRAYRFQSTLPARGATQQLHAGHPQRTISIHAPRTGSDLRKGPGLLPAARFQSTLPARGATMRRTSGGRLHLFQSTLPARGATRNQCFRGLRMVFQSTLPARGATNAPSCVENVPKLISIHAPRTGSVD